MGFVEMKEKSIAKYIMLYGSVAFYSCTSIFSKLASGQSFLSREFILFYGLEILVLMFYAVAWQQVLKRLELSVAYSAKPISTILSMVWGVVLFQEQLTWNMIVGAVVILCGIRMVVSEHGK